MQDLISKVDSDIQKAEQYLLEQGANSVEINLGTISNKKLLDAYVKNGFLPIQSGTNNKILFEEFLEHYYLDKLSTKELRFWYGESAEELLKSIAKSGLFMYCNIKGWIDYSIKNGIALPLLLYDKTQVYKSKRPKTDMLLFKQVTSLKYVKNSVRAISKYTQSFKLLDGTLVEGVSVTRYANGMSNGLYYDNQGEYCGTFYYQEPESTTFLIGNIRIFRNKHVAYQSLWYEAGLEEEEEPENLLPPAYEEEGSSQLEQIYDRNHYEFIQNYYAHPEYYPEDMYMTPDQFYKLSIRNVNPVDVPPTPRYIGAIAGLMSIEDEYDQPLCKLALSLGIDLIVLTHMIGSHQIVSEVLDTRPRLTSFANLAYPEN